MAKSIKFDIPDTGKFFLTEEISLSIASTENDGILSWVATSPAGKTSEIGTEPTINIKLSLVILKLLHYLLQLTLLQ